MSWASSEVVAVLTFLLPGFVAAAIFYSLTSHPKPNEFGQVVQTLVFTTVGQAIAWAARWTGSLAWAGYAWPPELELAVAVVSSIVVALIVVYCSNHDTAHGALRRIGITRETSYPSEWYSAFAELPRCYVMLYLKDKRHLCGWAEEWPSNHDRGHFSISEGIWAIRGRWIRTPGVILTLVPASDVEMVEFLETAPQEN